MGKPAQGHEPGRADPAPCWSCGGMDARETALPFAWAVQENWPRECESRASLTPSPAAALRRVGPSAYLGSLVELTLVLWEQEIQLHSFWGDVEEPGPRP